MRFHRLAAAALAALLVGCGGSQSGGSPPRDAREASPDATPGKNGGAGGGATATGGATGTGGQTRGEGGVLGGAPGGGGAASGGTTSTGGSPRDGGAQGTGGTLAAGGVTGADGPAGAGGATGGGGTRTDGATSTGGATGTGGATATGGAGSGGVTGNGGATSAGELRITDQAPGFASVAGGTTGGGTAIASAVTVSTMSALQAAVKGSTPAIVLVEPGSYSGTLAPGANKTIIGKAPGVLINGNLSISGSAVSSVIVRNLAVKGLPCNSYEECKGGADAVYMGNGAHHIWLDHLDISDGQDGNCDATQGADYITVSWTRFHYSYDKEHRFSNLIAGSDDEPNSVGKLHITYMNCHWGERVDSRQPRGRFGNIHMLNNYHKTGGSQIHGVGKDMALIAENSVYQEGISIWTDMGSPRGWKGIGNEGTASDLNASRGTVFSIPYPYTPLPASKVVAALTAATCGAGNTCRLAE